MLLKTVFNEVSPQFCVLRSTLTSTAALLGLLAAPSHYIIKSHVNTVFRQTHENAASE